LASTAGRPSLFASGGQARARGELLAAPDSPRHPRQLLAAWDAWAARHLVPMASIRAIAPRGSPSSTVDGYPRGSPLPPELPPPSARPNIRVPAHQRRLVSGSMNYLGRAPPRRRKPGIRSSYEINASLQISFPSFSSWSAMRWSPARHHLRLSSELYSARVGGFEASVLTMNTPAAPLFEGIRPTTHPDGLWRVGGERVGRPRYADRRFCWPCCRTMPRTRRSFLTWGRGGGQPDVAAALRQDFLVSPERAEKPLGAWGRHPLAGACTCRLPRRHGRRWRNCAAATPADRVLPALLRLPRPWWMWSHKTALASSETLLKAG